MADRHYERERSGSHQSQPDLQHSSNSPDPNRLATYRNMYPPLSGPGYDESDSYQRHPSFRHGTNSPDVGSTPNHHTMTPPPPPHTNLPDWSRRSPLGPRLNSVGWEATSNPHQRHQPQYPPSQSNISVDRVPNPPTFHSPGTPYRSRQLAHPAVQEISRPLSASGNASPRDMGPPSFGMAQLGKRRRDDPIFGDISSPSSRYPSKRPTPDPTNPMSSAMSRENSHSSASLELTDADAQAIAELIGYDPRSNSKSKTEQSSAFSSFDRAGSEEARRLRQLEEDEEFARALQAQFDVEIMPSEPAPSSQNRSFSNTQSFFDSTGSLHRPAPPKKAEPPAAPQRTAESKAQTQAQAHNTPISFDSDDDLEVIDGTGFKANNRALMGQGGIFGGSGSSAHPPPAFAGRYGSLYPNLPGSFGQPFQTTSQPGFGMGGQGFVGQGGTSVYPTTMNQLAGRDPSDVGSMGFDNNALSGNMFNMANPFVPPSNFLPVLRTYMGWGEDNNEDDMFEGYGLGRYGGGEENSEALKDLLNNIRPDEENLGAGEEEKGGTPEGMADTANLYKYQQKGLAWLAKQEESTSKGGILADDMGLGKTIQAIALMVSRRSEDVAVKTNLIIAPVALIRQWESEIKNKVRRTHALSVYIYHGSGKTSSTWDALRHYDVVISTYGTLTADHKKKLQVAQRKKDNPNYVPRRGEGPVLTGDECRFYRCILDEAQNIKNKNARASLAAYEIDAKYRLCMTGTPMMNNVVELYSLIHFLKIQPYCQWEKFQIDFARPLSQAYSNGRERAMRKLQALCKAIMLRRTKNSQMDGKPLIVLPERHTASVHGQFDDDEMAFYKALEAKTQLTFNKFLKAGTVGRNYSNMLTLLLRLRQACCHPHLIRDFAVAVDAAPETLIENARDLPQAVIDRVIENGIADCPICMDTADNYTLFNPCGHSTCPECFCGLSDLGKNPNATHVEGGAKASFPCHTCRQNIDPTKVTDYIHFKKVYEPEKAAAEGLGSLEEEQETDTESEGEDESDDEDSEEEEDDETESLDGFIVKDEDPVERDRKSEEASGSDDLDDMKPAKLSQTSAVKREPKTETDGDSDSMLDLDDLVMVKPSRDEKVKQEEKEGGSGQRGTVKQENGEASSSNKSKPSTKAKKVKKEARKDVDDSDGDFTFVPGYNDGKNPFEKANGKNGKSKGKDGKKEKKDKKKGKGKSKRTTQKTLAELKKESMRNAKSRDKYFRRLAKGFIPSAKISKCMEILEEIMKAPEGEKVIVFSQFTSLLDLIEIPMHRKRWHYKRFDGSMNAVSRNRSVVEFTADPRVRVLLVSLKAGNAGLNLTAASQVIILDPFWNPYIEEQAIDRAHRIGQRRAVQVHRILIPETVEDRILQLQEKKRELIEGALDEGASKSIGRLGVRELGFLFGINS